MQASLERTETRSHCTSRGGDELRRQAESCRQLAASSVMERHKLVWLRLANEWLELARRADEVVISLKGVAFARSGHAVKDLAEKHFPDSKQIRLNRCRTSLPFPAPGSEKALIPPFRLMK